MFTHGYGNTFSGNAAAANVVGPQIRGEWANPKLAMLRERLNARLRQLANAGQDEESRKLEMFLYSVHHCGVPFEW